MEIDFCQHLPRDGRSPISLIVPTIPAHFHQSRTEDTMLDLQPASDNLRHAGDEDVAESAHGLASLTRRLLDDGVVQFYLGMRAQFPDAHLKDLVAQAMDSE